MLLLRRLLLTLVVMLTVVAMPVSPSAAQESADTLSIRSIDGADPEAVVVEFLYTGNRARVTDLVIREGGRTVPHSDVVLLEEEQDFGIVLAIDTSGSMENNGAFEQAIAAAQEFVTNKEADDRVAIVGFSDGVRVVAPFTDDTDRLLEAIGTLEADGGTALFDAVLASANLFADTDLIPNIILLTDGTEANSVANIDAVEAGLREQRALLFAIGIESESLDRGTLNRLALPTGGTVASADVGELSAIYRNVQASLRRQFRTTFVSSTERVGQVDLQLTIGTQQVQTAYAVAARIAPGDSIEAIPAPPGSGIGFLQSSAFFWLALAMLIAAAGGAVYAVGSTIVGERSTLDTVLQPYRDGFVARDEEEEGMITSALLQRAVDATGRFADRRGMLVRVEEGLEQANLPLRAGEALFFYLTGVVIFAILSLTLLGNLLGAVGLTVIVALVPPAALSFLGSRRRKQFDSQLPDMLNLLASTLRAGYSLMQAVEAAAEETIEPMKKELQRVVTESRLGMPVEVALDGVVARMRSKDFEWAVMAIRIQREVGGNLAELLITVADTMTQRERLRRDVSALTAEGRVSAMVLGFLPIGLGLAMWVLNPDYIGKLFEGGFGTVLVAVSAVMMVGGFAWMYKIIDIEI